MTEACKLFCVTVSAFGTAVADLAVACTSRLVFVVFYVIVRAFGFLVVVVIAAVFAHELVELLPCVCVITVFDCVDKRFVFRIEHCLVAGGEKKARDEGERNE